MKRTTNPYTSGAGKRPAKLAGRDGVPRFPQYLRATGSSER